MLSLKLPSEKVNIDNEPERYGPCYEQGEEADKRSLLRQLVELDSTNDTITLAPPFAGI